MALRLFFLYCTFNQNLFAYLDPSAGSLLLSSFAAVFASLIFFIRGSFYKIINLIKGNRYKGDKIGQESYGLVFYSEGRQYYSVFSPILDCLDVLGYPYLFLTSDKNDPALMREKKEKIRWIGEGNRAYFYLNTLQADLLVMTTPGLDVLQIKRTKKIWHYCHIVHALRTPNYRVFGLDYFDSILVNSLIQKEFIRKLEQIRKLNKKEIINVGSTYCDYLYSVKRAVEKTDRGFKKFFPDNTTKKVVLLSPSWGEEGMLKKYGMRIIEPILKSGFLLIIRPHPQSLIVEKEVVESLQFQIQGNKNVVWDIDSLNVYAMQESDVMISDFSGIIFDYLCLYEKPVLSMEGCFDHSGYDSADLGWTWEFSVLSQIGVQIHSDQLENIPNLINQVLNSKQKHREIQKLKEELWSFPHEAGERCVKALLEIHEKILEDKLSDVKGQYEKLFKIKELLRSK